MKAKRISAPDIKKAMMIAMEELGEEAVIISLKKTADGVEVVAALESDFHAAQKAAKDMGRQAASYKHETDSIKPEALDAVRQISEDIWSRYENEGAAAERTLREQSKKYDAMSEFSTKSPDRTINGGMPEEAFKQLPSAIKRETEKLFLDLKSEILGLKDIIESQSEPLNQIKIIKDKFDGKNGDSSGREKLIRRLDRLSIPDSIKARVVQSIDYNISDAEAWKKALVNLSLQIPVSETHLIHQGGMFAFVGPTGVGKTTTIGKLATDYVVKNGNADIALVTMDSFKIASLEQLKAFGRILNVPVHVVNEANNLDSVLKKLSDKRVVLIDTAGMALGDKNIRIQNNKLKETNFDVKNLIVLSASSQYELLERAWDNHVSLGIDGMVISKIDESGNLGPAITTAINKKVPVAYITDGQKVPQDIHSAYQRDIVARALQIAQAEASRLASKVKKGNIA